MKILIAGFQHETNTFAPSEADWDSFVEGGGMPGMVEGEALLDFKGINLPLGGFLDDLEGEGHEYLPVWLFPPIRVSLHAPQPVFNFKFSLLAVLILGTIHAHEYYVTVGISCGARIDFRIVPTF